MAARLRWSSHVLALAMAALLPLSHSHCVWMSACADGAELSASMQAPGHDLAAMPVPAEGTEDGEHACCAQDATPQAPATETPRGIPADGGCCCPCVQLEAASLPATVASYAPSSTCVPLAVLSASPAPPVALDPRSRAEVPPSFHSPPEPPFLPTAPRSPPTFA